MNTTKAEVSSDKVLVMMRKVLLYGFYCDLVIFYKVTNSVIDFESSKSTHRYHVKKIFHQLRDTYLKNGHNVTVIRRQRQHGM